MRSCLHMLRGFEEDEEDEEGEEGWGGASFTQVCLEDFCKRL